MSDQQEDHLEPFCLDESATNDAFLWYGEQEQFYELNQDVVKPSKTEIFQQTFNPTNQESQFGIIQERMNIRYFSSNGDQRDKSDQSK